MECKKRSRLYGTPATIKMEEKMDEISRTFTETGKLIGDNIPHIKLPEPKGTPDPFIEKFRKWALIILTILISASVLFLIIFKLINRFF